MKFFNDSDLPKIRNMALRSLPYFIKTVHPDRVLGHVHEDLLQWSTRESAKSHQLVLLPRDHQKSTMAAYKVAWMITRNPAIRVLYISSTANLAVKQLKFIKDILTCDRYSELWPEMLHRDEGKRTKWAETEIAVDHPKRTDEYIRDPTVFTAGLTTTIVGMHCDLAVLDDVVIEDNAYDESARTKVREQASYLASILGSEGELLAVGTRYHPKDLYNDMINTMVEVFDDEGNVIDMVPLYETFERQVEDAGDGTGNFLWPATKSHKGKWFGFNREILAKKRAQYYDKAKFRAQYYNDPNDPSESVFDRNFQYYDKSLLRQSNGKWFYKDYGLNIIASIDFAYSLREEADSTCIVVVGIDKNNNIYVLDIDRFKTKKISEYFDHLLRMHTKWGFRKLRAEVTAAQEVIVEDLKMNYIKPLGLMLIIDPHRPIKNKEDRVIATLQPRYNNKQMWHYRGGNCELLEEELILQRPPHDDIKDALAAAVEIAVPPSFMMLAHHTSHKTSISEEHSHKRFGGIS